MSTGLECAIIEVEPAVWWYLLEDGFAPKMAWDWREYANAYGPFGSEDEAYEHLRENHANPGGYVLNPFEPGYKPDENLLKLMEEAKERDKRERAARTYNPYRYRY